MTKDEKEIIEKFQQQPLRFYTPSITEWEYKLEHMDYPTEFILNKLGADGWEMCAILPGMSPLRVYFKRPLPETKETPSNTNNQA